MRNCARYSAVARARLVSYFRENFSPLGELPIEWPFSDFGLLCRDRQRDHERDRYLELSLHEPGNHNLHGISEHRLQASVIEHLSQNAARDVFWFATPNAARRSPHLGLRMKNEGLTAGVADLCILLPQGRAAWLEMKAAGGRQSIMQKGFETRCRRLQHPYKLAYSLEEAVGFLREVGALR